MNSDSSSVGSSSFSSGENLLAQLEGSVVVGLRVEYPLFSEFFENL